MIEDAVHRSDSVRHFTIPYVVGISADYVRQSIMRQCPEASSDTSDSASVSLLYADTRDTADLSMLLKSIDTFGIVLFNASSNYVPVSTAIHFHSHMLCLVEKTRRKCCCCE